MEADVIGSVSEYQDRFERKEELGRGRFGVVYVSDANLTHFSLKNAQFVIKKVVRDFKSGSLYASKHIRARKREVKQQVKEEIGQVINDQ